MKKSTKIVIAVLVVAVVGFGAVFLNSDYLKGFLKFNRSTEPVQKAPTPFEAISTPFEAGPSPVQIPEVDAIHRDEFAKLLANAKNLPDEGTDCGFSDILDSQWYICAVAEAGYMVGYSDGTFGPGNAVNRAEGAKIVREAFDLTYACPLPKLYDDVDKDAWYFVPVNSLAVYEISDVEIGENFNPGDVLSFGTAQDWINDASTL
ncbi:MAG: S-layer homology domain-containing protein [Candidatus Peregrinibacteria bacterium]